MLVHPPTLRSLMINVRHLLPRLTVNRRLLQAVVDERGPCCALGVVELRKRQLAAIILGAPEVAVPAQLGDGFWLGQRAAYVGGVQALRLDFAFQGLKPLQVVLDPANKSAWRVLAAIVEADAYFVLVVSAHRLAAFRADTRQEERLRLNDLLRQAAGAVHGTERLVSQARSLNAQTSGLHRLPGWARAM